MERTVPRTDSDAIELYVRTYYSLLRSSSEIAIETLVESHIGMESLLHVYAGQSTLDVSALVYASLRLPSCIVDTNLVLLGQRSAVFNRWGYNIEEWQEVTTSARRRRSYYDGQNTLAMYIASRSDIDDVIPALTAYQIEWNKLHHLLNTPHAQNVLQEIPEKYPLDPDQQIRLAEALSVSAEAFSQLHDVWAARLLPILTVIARAPKRLYLRLLAGSLTDYRKATNQWWTHIRKTVSDIHFGDRRVYFVSSNTHSLLNMWSGYALQRKEALLTYIEDAAHQDLLEEYQGIEAQGVQSNQENFFYYVLKKFLQDADKDERERQLASEREVGIHHVESEHGFDLSAQIFEMRKLRRDWIDPRVCTDGMDILSQSDAIILNIDYPLGMAAYEIFTRISENVGDLCGIYVMGKAATLNGRVGDVMIPTVIHDEHSNNTYLFQNCFSAKDVAPYLVYGNVLDNQKSVTVRGTFLQNQRYMSVFYREGYTDIEMEAGPYLSGIYEMSRPKRHPHNEIVSLHPVQYFDVGFIHYASDKPLSKGQNLGIGSLSYRGMDPTYAATAAILGHIIQREAETLQMGEQP